MLRKLIVILVIVAVGAFGVAGFTTHASAFSEPIGTKISLVKPGKLYKIVSKPAVAHPIPAVGPGSPLDVGGSLKVTLNGEELTCTLAHGLWKGLGNPPGVKGYKYLNTAAPTGNACKLVLLKEKVIKVLAKATGTLVVNGVGLNGDLALELDAGSDSYCALAQPPYKTEKAGTMLKAKDAAPPASCAQCGDNVVTPPEECDGTDDGACPGLCQVDCTCAPFCGDNTVNGVEQCDGTDAAECAGLCSANCTCPEPACNNGVKEVGEECDPAGSTVDCGAGEVCGGFCECVPDVACACGSPEPTMYMYRTGPPIPGSVCGTTDGTVLTDLVCGGLYIGGGGGALPVPNFLPDNGMQNWNIDQCVGTDMTLVTTSVAQVGKRHCSEGKRCSGGTKDGEACIRDRHCPGGTCRPQCWFGSYLSILNKATPQLSTCVSDEIFEDSLGGADCATGRFFTRVPVDSVVHLTGSDMSASTPGYQPCPICVGGTLDVPGSGICEGGPDKNKPCMPMTTRYDSYKCCSASSSKYSQDCTDDSDCPGGACLSGCGVYPTSLDCRPHPLTVLGPGLLQVLRLNTEGPGAYKNTVVADDRGTFCGWCRDVTGVGSGCFEGHPDPPDGPKGCPDSSVIACRPATYYSPPPVGGNPADIAECGDALRCRTDADCTYPYGTCTQRNPGAGRDASIKTMVYDGAYRPGDLRDKMPHDAMVVTNYCIPPNLNDTIDGDSDLGGPGALTLPGMAGISPSGAFIDMRRGLLD